MLERLPCDLFLGAHVSFYLMEDKRGRLASGDRPNPFIDPDLYRRHVAGKKRRFLEELARQQDAASGPA